MNFEGAMGRNSSVMTDHKRFNFNDTGEETEHLVRLSEKRTEGSSELLMGFRGTQEAAVEAEFAQSE